VTDDAAHPRRVVVITNQVSAEQSALWEAAEATGRWEVHLAGPRPREGIDAFVPSAAPPALRHVHRLDARDLRPGTSHLWWLMPGMGELFAKVRPHVVHVNTEPWGLLVLQALRRHPVVVVHGAENHFDSGGRFERTLRIAVATRNLRRISGYASWNQAGEELARKHGLRPGVPTSVLPAITASPAPARPDRASQPELVVGFVGRLTPEKGLAVLLEALELLVAQGHRVRLRVVGEGPESATLAAVTSLPVELAGSLPNERTRALMAECDVLAVPSLTAPDWAEQFGRVVVEAFAESVPVVVSSSGALPEVVADAGVVVPEGDAAALAAALAPFVEQDYRAAQARAARERYDATYRPEVLAEELVDLWDRAAGLPPG
jgi:glycosyltransferase involved in cell wall biosynthesis